MFVDRIPDTQDSNEPDLSKDMIFDSKLSVQSTNKIIKQSSESQAMRAITQDMHQIQTEENQAYELLQLVSDFRSNQRWHSIEIDEWAEFFEQLEENLVVLEDRMKTEEQMVK